MRWNLRAVRTGVIAALLTGCAPMWSKVTIEKPGAHQRVTENREGSCTELLAKLAPDERMLACEATTDPDASWGPVFKVLLVVAGAVGVVLLLGLLAVSNQGT